MTSDLKKAACVYANMGLYILPAEPRGKKLLKKTLFKKPTRDKEIIDYWWDAEPNANIAVPLSVRNNALIVLDLDIRGSVCGFDSLIRYLNETGQSIPDTLTVKTGSGGRHLYYKNSRKLVQTGRQHILPCVDVRAENAYVIAPPSVHKSGNRYETVSGSFQAIADANDAVYDLLEKCRN